MAAAGIYLYIEFDWPSPFDMEHAKLARKLHDTVQGKTWIKEAVASAGGLGTGPDSSWVFWLENYGALDRLLRDQNDDVSKAYSAFFSMMPVVTHRIREETLFL